MPTNRSFGVSDGGGGAVDSVNGQTGVVVLDAGDVGALDPALNLSDVANAGTSRTNLGLGDSATKNTGTTAGTVAAGDDSRITGAAQKASNLSDLASASTARTNLGLGDSATKNTGTTAGTVAAGDDSRFSAAAPTYAIRTSDDTRTSTTTVTNDTQLSASVSANAKYEVDLLLIYNGSNSGDLKIGFTAPSGATFQWSTHSADTGELAPNAVPINVIVSILSDTEVIAAFGTGTDVIARIKGVLVVSSTAGTLQLQWAQATSNGTATTLKANSFMKLSRIS